MNSQNAPLLVFAIIASVVILVVFGQAISQVGGAIGSATSDSANELIGALGAPTVLLALVIAAGFVICALSRR